jgi:hypothetical protein
LCRIIFEILGVYSNFQIALRESTRLQMSLGISYTQQEEDNCLRGTMKTQDADPPSRKHWDIQELSRIIGQSVESLG